MIVNNLNISNGINKIKLRKGKKWPRTCVEQSYRRNPKLDILIKVKFLNRNKGNPLDKNLETKTYKMWKKT